MNELELVYCFTFKLTEPGIFKKYKKEVVNVIKTSIEYNKRFHKIYFYLDEYTKDILGDLQAECIITDTSNFRFSDDFKLCLHPLLTPNQVMIDFDIFLNKPLVIDNSYDIILDRYEPYRYFYRYERTISKLLPGVFKSYLLTLQLNKKQMPNIGILKVNNKELWELYISEYQKQRRHLLQSYNTSDCLVEFSPLLGQYLLNTILLNSNYQVFLSNDLTTNEYLHLNTYEKYFVPLDRLLRKLKYKNII
jgi:hypothetical protein